MEYAFARFDHRIQKEDFDPSFDNPNPKAARKYPAFPHLYHFDVQANGGDLEHDRKFLGACTAVGVRVRDRADISLPIFVPSLVIIFVVLATLIRIDIGNDDPPRR
jgi:hypothetical protein